ncbi:MAG: methyltransferase [Solirubrobacteraceae bacterium]
MSVAATPADRLYGLMTGYYASAAVYAGCVLGVFDRIAEGERDAAGLAERCDADPGSMQRLLRMLASLDLVAHDGVGFELTETGRLLCSDGQDSMHALALQFASPGQQGPWMELAYSVRTGSAAFEHAHGMDPFRYMAAHPDSAAVFNAAMAFLGGQSGAALARGAAHDFSRLGSVVDVGGGLGAMLANLLDANPGMRGTLFELPHTAEQARGLLAQRGLADRCEVVAGDVFADPLPVGADAYLLKHVIHDFDDARAVEILRACRRAMAPSSRTLIIETVHPDRVQPDPLHVRMSGSDLNMLVQLGGRERTQGDFRRLIEAAGMTLQGARRVGDLPCGMSGTTSILEAAPC